MTKFINTTTSRGGKALIIEDARILPGTWRNFAGAATRMNKAGNHTFSVEITDEKVADELIKDGWNVKVYQSVKVNESTGEKYPPVLYLPVKFSYEIGIPPVIKEVKDNKDVVNITKEMVGSLDDANIVNVRLYLVQGKEWTTMDGSKTGHTAYLNSMRYSLFRMNEDPFAEEDFHLNINTNELPF